MIDFCGSNVFGQWCSGDFVIHKFQTLHQKTDTNSQSAANCGKLILIRWGYNIFLNENSYILSGHVHGTDFTTEKVNLPHVYDYNVYSLETDLLISGNDYKLIIVDIRTEDLWIHDFNTKGTWDWTQVKLKLNIVTTIAERDIKRTKSFNQIKKVITTNSVTCLLTCDGDLYEYPNKINTSKCIGTLCDFDYGHEHGILLTDAGVVYTWGNGRRCQLGHGSLSSSEVPVEVEALSGIKITQVKAGGWHCMALSESGDVYSWGWNESGQLGIKEDVCDNEEQSKTGSLKSYPLPKLVDVFDKTDAKLDINIIQIACGNRHSAILLDDYSIWTTGSNKYGQLGVGRDFEVVKYFKKVTSINKNCQLLCGPWSTVATQ